MDFIEIGSLFSAGRHFIIPDYQREYSWEKTQNLTLWRDIVELTGDKKAKHFLGALVTSPYQREDTALAVIRPEQFGLDATEVSHLLDGQQRLTSISLLLAAILSVVDNDPVLEDNRRELLVNTLEGLLFDEDSTDDDDRPSPRLFLKEESGKFYYRNILKTGMVSESDKRFKSVRNMRTALNTYTNEVRDWNNESDPEERYVQYNRLISTIKNRIQVVDIRCGKNMNEFQVFESLNGKGLNLTAIDRIKSIYISRARASKDDGSSKWQAFYSKLDCDDKKVLHFFTSFFFYREGRRVSKINLPDRFKQMAHGSYQSFSSLDAELQDTASTYSNLRNASTGCNKVDITLTKISKLDQEQIYVPLYAAASLAGTDDERFNRITDKLLIYAVRHAVCGRPKNALDTEFSIIINKMKEDTTFNDAIDYIETITEDDKDFRYSFARFSTTNASFARYLLEELELYTRLQENSGNPIPAQTSLEHVIPQTINYEDWFGADNIPDRAVQDSFKEDVINRIGNMVLLNQCDNSAASNKNYLSKRDIYINGSNRVHEFGIPYNTYELVRGLVDNYADEFTEKQVEERSQDLAKQAVYIWSFA